MSEAARRRLLIAFAHAEEELLETHVQNALDVYDAVGDEMPLDRAIEMYLESVDIAEPQGSIIARTAMARLEESSARRRGRPRRSRSGRD